MPLPLPCHRYRYPGGRFFDEEALLRDLSTPLRDEVCIFRVRAHLRELQIDPSDTLAASLAHKLSRQLFLRDDCLIRASQPSIGMFFLAMGRVEILKGVDEVPEPFVGSRIVGEMALLQQQGLPVNKTNLYAMFVKMVKRHMHVVLAMSPLGEEYRVRIRQFPSLINNTTISWFFPWPEDALSSVARQVTCSAYHPMLRLARA